MPKPSREKAEALARIALDAIHDRLYEPWEWSDMASLPKGYEIWSADAVYAYMEGLVQKMADAIMRESK